MDVHTNIPLKNYTTMGLGGNARFMAEARTADEVMAICRNAKKQKLPIFILGGGSNVIAKDSGFNGLVLRVRIPGFDIVADDLNTTTVKIGAGEGWDNAVDRLVKMHLSGVESMSGIPGTAGATPIQNVGAYGQEITDTLQSLEAYDIKNDKIVTLSSEDCKFSYRNSIFRSEDAGRYVVLSITLKLSKNSPQAPFYDTLQKYLDERGIKTYSHETIRNAVLDIRKNKLPDPKISPNSGSFFKNAIVEAWELDRLRAIDPNIPTFDMGNGQFKIPSGWLIEKAGLKGAIFHGMRIHDKNALVLINESATSYSDLAKARDEIIGKIRDAFRIQIEQEPLEI